MRLRSLIWAGLFAGCLTSTTLALADVDTLNRQVVQLYGQGRYAEAIDIARQAVAEAEAAFGPDHATTATSLNNLAELYRIDGPLRRGLAAVQAGAGDQ